MTMRADMTMRATMKRGAVLPFGLVLALTAVLLTAGSAPLTAQPDTATGDHKVLVLHSYSGESRWTSTMDRAIHETFAASDVRPAVFVEHMDSKRYDFGRIAAPFRALLEAKYDVSTFSVVMVTDDNAAEFAARNRTSLFGDIPIVFAGANAYTPKLRERLKPATGVAEEPDIAGTIDIALALHPEADTLVAVSDVTTTGRLNLARFNRAVEALSGEYEVRRLSELPTTHLREGLAALPANAVVFNLSLFRTADDRVFGVEEASAFLSSATDAPVYTSWDFSVAGGVVGGLTVSSAEQGAAAAALALRILEGSPAESIPVVEESPNRYIFDYQAARSQGIRPGQLPEDAILRNEPEGVWYRYAQYVIIALAIIVVLSGVVVALTVNTFLRRQAERRLRESEQRYRRIFRNLQDVYLEVDPTREQIVEISPSVARFGYDPADLIGAPAATLFASDQEWEQLCLAVGENAEEPSVEREAHIVPGPHRATAGGRTGADWIPVAVAARLAETEDERRIIAMVRDVSEQWRRANELRRLYRAVDAAGHAIYITDMDGVIQYVNDAFATITGYPREEALGNTPRLFRSGEMSRDYYRRLWETIRAGKTWSEEIINARKDGSLYVALQSITPVADESGRQRWYVAVQIDKTEQKEIERALAESERSYRLLAENATDMISRHDPTGAYTYVSPASRPLLGYEPSELVGRNAYELFHPEDLPSITESHESIRGGNNISFVTYRIRTRNGDYLWVETTSKTITDPDTGELTEIIAVTRDATRRIEMEDSLRQAKQLAEEASAAKSVFLANVSHEIRTPLNAIIGLGELLERRISDPASRRYLGTIRNSSRTLLQLINDILDLSKVEARRLDIHLDYVTLSKLLGEIESMFEIQVDRTSLRFSVDYEAVEGYEVRTDPHRLRQVLINLVGNAIKFTRRGEVRMTAAVTPTGGEAADVEIRVSDTGIGIPAEKRQEIFDAFAQADAGSSREFGGTGLGLAISKSIVELLGGSIHLETEEGVGSTFTVRLPDLAFYRRPVPQPAGDGREGARQDAVGDWEREREALRGELNKLTAEHRHELVEEMARDAVSRWRAVQRVKRFDDMGHLGDLLIDIGRDHDVPCVGSIGSSLLEAVREFDVAAVDYALRRFEVVARTLGIMNEDAFRNAALQNEESAEHEQPADSDRG